MFRTKQLNELESEHMAVILNDCIKEQGSCERLKTFPFPRQYAYFSGVYVWILLTMEQVGDSSEDPFSMGLNDVPISAICRDIEIELLEILGEINLPEKIAPVADVLL
ncbi:hypothetical protein BH11CYA1_BH11CYA1_15950 [soil metagenome]